MALEISSTLLARLLNEAESDPRREACGLLFGTPDRVDRAARCGNVAEDPGTAFEIDPVDLIAAHRAARDGGPTIIGCYHSHPTGSPLPSPRDAAAAAPDGALWLILASGQAAFFRAIAHGPIEGRFVAIPHRIGDR